MIENLKKSNFNHILFLGLLLFPISVFSQEQSKRVTVVVNAKEISNQKEVVQIPADNRPKKTIENSPEFKNNSAERTAAKKATQPLQETKPIASIGNTAKKSAATNTPSKLPISNSAEVATAHQPKKTATIDTVLAPKADTIAKVVLRSDTSVTVEKDSTTLSSTSAKVADETLLANAKATSFNYIWIGVFLIIAGVVLGLLFGRPAFLIAFVGVVFIIIGVVI